MMLHVNVCLCLKTGEKWQKNREMPTWSLSNVEDRSPSEVSVHLSHLIKETSSVEEGY